MSGGASSSGSPICSDGAYASAGRNKESTLSREQIAARITCVIDHISSWLKSGTRKEFATLTQLSYILARGIDFAITAGEVYPSTRNLPNLIKQVFKLKNEVSLQPALMMLLLSVKNACRHGWFSKEDEKEFIAMENEMSNIFCYGSSAIDETKISSAISKVLSRFYPILKLDKLITSFEAKVGYQILVIDFIIPCNTLPQASVLLFVARTDENMETSSCLINPPHANLLINGRPVERRTCGFSDVGPQFPTDVTRFLKYGTNIIQAIGTFGGEYVIAIGSMSLLPFSALPSLQDYISPDFATDPPDDDLVEGPSKISLNCPISFKRIKTPVKGHLCKHHQCFDYENYLNINFKRPFWRCPHCNQSVSFVDLRIDGHMCKILSDTGTNATHVVIGSDGHWKVVDTAEEPDKGTGSEQSSDTAPTHESNGPSISVVDLTVEEAEDHLQSQVQFFHQTGGGKNISSDDRRLDIPTGPVITDAVSPALVRENADMGNFQLWQNQTHTDAQTQDILRNLNAALNFGFQAQDVPTTVSQTGRQTISSVQVLPTLATQHYDSQQQWNTINAIQNYYNDALWPQSNVTPQSAYNNGVQRAQQQMLNHQLVGQSSGSNNPQPGLYNSWTQQVLNQGPVWQRPNLSPAQQSRGFPWSGQV